MLRPLHFRLMMVFAYALVSALTGSLPAHAVQSGSLGIYPTNTAPGSRPWLQYHLAAGQTRNDSVTVDNRSSQPVDALLYAVDAAPTGDGGFGMQSSGSRPSDAGAWLHLNTAVIHIDANSTQVIGFRFSLPPDVAVGAHYAGIVLQPLQPSLQRHNSFGVQVITRLGVRMYETVPGVEHSGLELKVLQRLHSPGPLRFGARLTNTGNSLLIPRGYLQVRQLGGGKPVKIAVNLGGAIAPNHHASLIVPTAIQPGWFPNRYVARLSLRYGSAPQHTMTKQLRFWTGSWLGWLVVGASAAMLLAAGLMVLRRLWRPHRPRTSSAHDSPP